MKIALLFALGVWFAAAQITMAGLTNQLEVISNVPAGTVQAGTNHLTPEQVQKVRMFCIESRRLICGKVVKILPDGLVINSGYTNLARPQLDRSWLVSGTVVAGLAADTVEEQQPDALCIGQVLLTDIPRVPRHQAALKLYDYVILEGFPTGRYTYTSVGEVRHTVRRFSASLVSAMKWNLGQPEK